MSQVLIIKHGRTKHAEPFDADKLLASVYAACLSVRLPEGVASDTAKTVTIEVARWLRDKIEVTSDDIRRTAARSLENISKEASYIYQNYKKLL